MVNTVILAGKQSIRGSNDGENKALLRIKEKMMVEYVADAVKNACGIDKVVVIGPVKELAKPLEGKVDAVLEPSGSLTENLMAGLKYLGYERNLLICTSDIPLITPEAIDDFLHKVKGTGADFCYPIIEKKLNDKKFPGMERTYVKVREGLFTGGNIFYVNPNMLEGRLELVDKLIEARKNPAKMARLLSMGLMLQLMAGTLSIQKVEKRISELMNIKVKAVITEYPEIGNDVDKTEDLAAVSLYLSRQNHQEIHQ